MIPYFISLTLLFFSTFIKEKIIRSIVMYSPAFIICFGYMTGSDWRSYELIYDGTMTRIYEPGLDILFYLGNYLNIPFWPFLISLKLICYHKLINIFEKYFNKLSGILLILFFAEWGFYLFIDNPTRNFISFYFSLFFIDNLLSGNKKKALLFALIASVFHFSSIFLIVMFFLEKVRIKYIIFVFIFLFSTILILTNSFSIINYLLDSQLNNFVLYNRLFIYLENDAFISDMRLAGYIHRIIFITLIGLGIRAFNVNDSKKLILNFSMIYLALYPLTSQITILKRIDLFLVFSFCFAIYIIYSYTRFKTLLLSFIFTYSFLKSFLLFTSDYRYAPYSNYLIEILKGEDKGYYERTKYNYKNSPYAK